MEWTNGLGSRTSEMNVRLLSSNLPSTFQITCSTTINSVFLGKVNVIILIFYTLILPTLIYFQITVTANFDKTLESVIGEALLSGVGGLLMLNSNLIKTVSLFLLIINYPL